MLPSASRFPFRSALSPFACVLALTATSCAAPTLVDFNTQVRPILSDNCFKCHGFDPETRKGGRRLDTREGSLAEKDGVKAIVPGDLEESDVHARIHSSDKDEQMPPPKSGKKLSPEQIAILDQWILQGAHYDVHWAFVKPVQAPLPAVNRPDWCRNALDYFILTRLDHEGLAPSPEADRYTLIRRLSYDLNGLPPTPEEVAAFVNDQSADAYERLVDRLLASPHYGERAARRWLDLARYADTNGYEKDRERSIWPYRDWVIRAFNNDMPFDQFTIEQLAGDLLPNATEDQKIATGFHRNTMLNEEGGIDPLEYRYLAMVDRVATTGATWLGLTVQCAQCHTHKYDPITQREYYRLMAFLDNADEPEMDLPPPDAADQLHKRETRLTKLITDLPDKYPVPELQWETRKPSHVESTDGEEARIQEDGSVLFPGPIPDKVDDTLTVEAGEHEVQRLRLEALADPSLPKNGPGRAVNGNFVLSEISVMVAPKDAPDKAEPIHISHAEADASQQGFPIENAVDGKLETGWAIDTQYGSINVNRTASFTLEKPAPAGSIITVKLSQQYGRQHTLGKVRLSVGAGTIDTRSLEVQRHELMEKKFGEWLERERARAVKWTVLRPIETKSNLPLLTVEKDGAVFVSGDMTKSDLYELKFRTDLRGITAFRLEVLPDDRLPAHGPGRIYYEGSHGDFFLSEFTLFANGGKVPFAKATSSFNKGAFIAAKTIDGDPQSGWSIDGGQGMRHEAVFNLAAPMTDSGELVVKLLCERYFAAGLGKFRISVTTDPAPAEAREMSDDVGNLLLIPDARLTAEQRTTLRNEFLLDASELQSATAEITSLRHPVKWPTTLVLQERPPENPRKTYLHHRGEFLQPKDRVEPGTIAALGEFPADAPKNRLGLAKWLVSGNHPLTGRVVMNREWAAFFGRGIVRTIGDFGFQGDPPSHPELLDWLAVEFVKEGWSMKKMEKLIVMSAAYRQSSVAAPEQVAGDPENKWVARGPRFRLDAEAVRDGALRESGLLSDKIGGPSVRPPQPVGVTEVAYGSPAWKASDGPDRYRRSIYTFSKRTAPFALYNTFDAPTGEACIVRRDRSDTPLQALALLNDVVFVEASRALGKEMASQTGTVEWRVDTLFQRCLSRPPAREEIETLEKFLAAQKARFAGGELDARAVAGDGPGDVNERAAWTVLVRAIFNLDESVTRS